MHEWQKRRGEVVEEIPSLKSGSGKKYECQK
jgi:hypothetical protein